MPILVKLCKAINPEAKTEDLNREVKRKFFHGIPDPLRRNLFLLATIPLMIPSPIKTYYTLLEMQRLIFPAVQLPPLRSIYSNSETVLMWNNQEMHLTQQIQLL